jgi:hypothetical protein
MKPRVPTGEQHIIDATNALDKVDWYIYYRARAEQDALLHERVSAMQARILHQFGVSGALKRRPQMRDGLHTWMEVYIAAPSNFDEILKLEVLTAKLLELIEGERHVEHFWDVSSCA